ncbi:ras-associating and dilute domain-containing protein isoform D [Alligator mississippiensis]|uniref:Ras-associating and dilute domain-containing protein n=1 Tax=Alligator mississippiensis TaxID=8496 RepID=A0A151N1V9_ALLMI|nr:ras-associating and dilute domain-containing protein isoform D [Alligator mississippiensis]
MPEPEDKARADEVELDSHGTAEMFMSRILDFQKTRYARFMNHRVPSNRRYQPTEYEHAANCATHAFWILPSILGSSILYFLSDDQWETISAWIYGFGLSGLFIVSTIFHTISWKKRHLRTVEHCLHMFDRMVIYFFIAASYAPWLNLRELGPWAAHMRWIIWIMASVGTVYVFFFHERYKLVELVCYVIMGFFPALVILSMPNRDGLLELVAGGLFYCLGMVFFKSDGRIPFAHAIWHLFVAIGAGIHYYAIWRPWVATWFAHACVQLWPGLIPKLTPHEKQAAPGDAVGAWALKRRQDGSGHGGKTSFLKTKLHLMTTSHTMFYGSSPTMAPPSRSKLKRQSRIFSQVLYRTLSYKDRSSVSAFPGASSDDPAELSTQLSAPGVLKIFGGNICAGTNYKSVLATGSSSARELAKEALERYGLSKVNAGQYVLCDVIGRFEGCIKQWQTEGLRVLGDNEKPLLIQDLWKPREGYARRFELRKRSEVEELAAQEVDTLTAGNVHGCRSNGVSSGRRGKDAADRRWILAALRTGINAQARKLQRNRAKGTMTLLTGCQRHATPPSLRRSVSETSLSQPGSQEEELKRHYSTLPETMRGLETSPGESPAPAPAEERTGGSMRYSLYQSPHLLLLQGYSQQHDSLASKPSISLSAPDILPLHCTIRRLKLSGRTRNRAEDKLLLEPILGASVAVNFSEDPVKAQPLPAQSLMRLKSLHRASDPELPSACKLCGSLLKERGSSSKKRGPSPATGRRAAKQKLQLEFERAVEDVLLRRILTLIEPGGDDHKLTPAFLLCLCIQHSAAAFEPGDFGQLLLKAAKMIQRTVWEKTKELAEKQSQHQDPASLSHFTIGDLVPDLQHILFWMSNSIELLYFIQQKSPVYIQTMEEEMDVKGSKESLFSSTITASEEAMTVLEDVIMYTFQQCVYYISKSLYVSLPGLLECNPFQNEGREGWQALPQLPEEIRRVALIYQETLDLLHQYEVHPEIASQMFAYLFFFSNTLLFNHLVDKGPSLGCFHWSKGVKIRACLRLLLDWVRGLGFEQLAEQFFSKLSSLADLLALPSSQLVQMPWPSLRVEFPALSPAQLHRVLTQYQAVSEVGGGAAWQPGEEDSALASRTDEVLESFDNHPPIILPSGGFQVDLEVETLDDNVYRHLLYIRHFLWSLRSKSPHAGDSLEPEPPKKDASTAQAVPEVAESASLLPLDPSCLLTPPNTPLNFDGGSPEFLQGPGCGNAVQVPRRNGLSGTKATTPEGSSPAPYDYPTPASSSRSSATDDFCYVFVVELEKGPIGLGMGLIDGLHTSLNSPGMYIRTLIQDSPAASDGRLSIGDRILAVNGTSLIGADYQSAVDLIRSGGKKLRFLVAKSDMDIAKKISSSLSPSS